MTHRLTLLLVEDDALIRLLLEEEQADAGFDLVTASSGEQAIAELEADASRFRGFVTDVRLGRGPDGWTVARRARELVPAVPEVHVSGDSAHEWTPKGVPNSVRVSKAFVAVQVITAISSLLNQASGPGTAPAP